MSPLPGLAWFGRRGDDRGLRSYLACPRLPSPLRGLLFVAVNLPATLESTLRQIVDPAATGGRTSQILEISCLRDVHEGWRNQRPR
jgi:hypothetical protein